MSEPDALQVSATSAAHEFPACTPVMVDERSTLGFRELYGVQLTHAARLDAAVSRIRIGGMDLGPHELGRLRLVRLVIGEMNALTFSAEVEAMTHVKNRAERLAFLHTLLREARLEVRIAPLAGWSPDFSVFMPRRGDGAGGVDTTPRREPEQVPPSRVVMLGPHVFERPHPHPGPAFGVVLKGQAALHAQQRFDELWRRAHDLNRPLLSILTHALRRSGSLPHHSP